VSAAAGTVRVFEDEATLAAAAAAAIVAGLSRGLQTLGRASLALSGGRTPGPAYRALAAEPLASRVEWERVRIYFADERAVPPGDRESNYRLAREILIDPLRIPPRNVHRMKGEYADLEAAAIEYEAHLDRLLDVVVLGLGEDGHVASLFPGSPLVGETKRRVAVVTDSPKPPARRLTLTPRALAESRQVLVLATGEAKAAAVARALEGDVEAREVPGRLARERDWYLDGAAAAGLRRA
jgi:6-phosphogluconolactonase